MGSGVVVPGPPRFEAGETYTFGLMAAIIGERLGIERADISQFIARMRRFSRLGLCARRQRGRGNPSSYSAYDALQFYVAMRLNLLGLNPEAITPLAEEMCCNLSSIDRSPVSVWLQPAFGGAPSELLLEIPEDILQAGLAARDSERKSRAASTPAPESAAGWTGNGSSASFPPAPISTFEILNPLGGPVQRLMTPEEMFEQRVSFVYGQQDFDNPNPLTKDEIRDRLRGVNGGGHD